MDIEIFNKFLLCLVVILVIPGVFAASVTLRPDGNGFHTAWSNYGCNAASEWDCVDDVSVTSDHVASSSNNIRETFNFTTSGLTSESINNVTLYYFAKRISSSKNNIQTLIRSGSVDYLGNSFILNNSYEYYSQTYTTNPATGSAWTVAEVDALETGMRTAASQGGGNITQIYAIVYYNPLSDLIISNLTLSQASAFEGEIVTVTVTTKNNGAGNAGGSTTRVANGGNHDFNVSALSSGSSQVDSFNYTCGTSNVTFTGTADVLSVVSESNEGNNQLTKALECKPNPDLPDLIIENITFLEYTTNSTLRVTVNITVKNTGVGNAGASTTRAIALTNTSLSTPALTSGSSYVHVRDYACTAAHDFTAIADFLAVVTESDEGNNQLTTTIDCVL